ncbi:unnamed protein product [Microthlaspi erraticum]|uniref:Pectinesterase inhibitor domain-containing protein n=1 Tax=Microthlaspi erraticum TaxID=1685480 RepID=A0A6D2KKK7_9BRAS|nr:unnamed protein product [Microthlaspi erraticum]
MGFDGDKKRKCIIAGSATGLLVIIVVVFVAVGTSKNSPDDNETRQNTNSKAIKAVCAPTDFKELCVKRLMEASPKSTEPLELIKLSFNFTNTSINDSLTEPIHSDTVH